MKLTLHAFLLLVTLSLSHYAQGANKALDPLWEKVVARQITLNKWVAKNIEQIVLETPKGEATKKTSLLKQFARIEKAKPIYDVLEVIPASHKPKDADENADFGAMFRSLDSGLFTTKAPVKRGETQVLNGKSLAVFALSVAGLNIKFWVDPDTGEVHQKEFQGGMSFVMSGTMTTTYNTGSSIRNLPIHATTKVSIYVPFQKAEIEIKDIYSNWFEL